MNCKKNFTDGLNENCFCCMNFKQCITDYAAWFDRKREKQAEFLRITNTEKYMDVYFHEELILSICKDMIQHIIYGCEDMCDMISHIRGIIEGILTSERMEEGKQPLSDIIVSAIISVVADSLKNS